jgi:hypothetical protein
LGRLPRRVGLLEVELALFVPQLVELELLPRRVGLLEVALVLFLPSLMELRLTDSAW